MALDRQTSTIQALLGEKVWLLREKRYRRDFVIMFNVGQPRLGMD
jgi:hypothetical protein